MPSYIVHLAVASQIIEKEKIIDKDYIEQFLVGSIIADTSKRTEKKGSHFWDDDTFKRLDRKPNLNSFLEKYGERLKEPFYRGYYGHLYLDYIFVDEYWEKNFLLLDSNYKSERAYDLVKYFRLNNKNVIYDRDEFLSEKLYYGDYDKIPYYIQKKYNIILPELNNKEWEAVNDYEGYIEEISYCKVKPQLETMVEAVRETANTKNIKKEKLKVFNMEEIYDLIDRTVTHLLELNNKS